MTFKRVLSVLTAAGLTLATYGITQASLNNTVGNPDGSANGSTMRKITDGAVSAGALSDEVIVATQIQGGSANSVTLAAANSVPAGRRVTVINGTQNQADGASGSLGVVPSGTDQIIGGTGTLGVAALNSNANTKATFVSDGNGYWFQIA